MYANRVQPSDNGPAIYRYLVGNAIIAAGEALEDEELFGARVEWCITVAWPVISNKEEPEWEETINKHCKRLYGRLLKPGEEIPKILRHVQLREIISRCRRAGVLDYKQKPVSDGTDYFGDIGNKEEE